MGYVSWRVNHWTFFVAFSTHVHRVHFHIPAFRTRCARNSSHTCGVETSTPRLLEGKISWQKHGGKKGSLRHEAEYPHIIIKKVVIFKYHYNKSHLHIFNERSIQSHQGDKAMRWIETKEGWPGCNLADCLQAENGSIPEKPCVKYLGNPWRRPDILKDHPQVEATLDTNNKKIEVHNTKSSQNVWLSQLKSLRVTSPEHQATLWIRFYRPMIFSGPWFRRKIFC